MNDDTRELFDDILRRWHHWSRGYRPIADVGASPMFNLYAHSWGRAKGDQPNDREAVLMTAMTTSGAKRSVRAWLVQFYRDNPHEELSFSDIVKKYGCSLWTARQAVYELQRDGVLESVHVVRTRLKGMGK